MSTLERLKKDSQDVLFDLKNSFILMEGVVYSDLRVVTVRKWEDEVGDYGYTVVVEPASPGSGLSLYMVNKLEELGWMGVEVVVQWG